MPLGKSPLKYKLNDNNIYLNKSPLKQKLSDNNIPLSKSPLKQKLNNYNNPPTKSPIKIQQNQNYTPDNIAKTNKKHTNLKTNQVETNHKKHKSNIKFPETKIYNQINQPDNIQQEKLNQKLDEDIVLFKNSQQLKQLISYENKEKNDSKTIDHILNSSIFDKSQEVNDQGNTNQYKTESYFNKLQEQKKQKIISQKTCNLGQNILNNKKIIKNDKINLTENDMIIDEQSFLSNNANQSDQIANTNSNKEQRDRSYSNKEYRDTSSINFQEKQNVNKLQEKNKQKIISQKTCNLGQNILNNKKIIKNDKINLTEYEMIDDSSFLSNNTNKSDQIVNTNSNKEQRDRSSIDVQEKLNVNKLQEQKKQKIIQQKTCNLGQNIQYDKKIIKNDKINLIENDMIIDEQIFLNNNANESDQIANTNLNKEQRDKSSIDFQEKQNEILQKLNNQKQILNSIIPSNQNTQNSIPLLVEQNIRQKEFENALHQIKASSPVRTKNKYLQQQKIDSKNFQKPLQEQFNTLIQIKNQFLKDQQTTNKSLSPFKNNKKEDNQFSDEKNKSQFDVSQLSQQFENFMKKQEIQDKILLQENYNILIQKFKQTKKFDLLSTEELIQYYDFIVNRAKKQFLEFYKISNHKQQK